jgi:hypothetical protein
VAVHGRKLFRGTSNNITPQQTSRAVLQASSRRGKHHARTSIIIAPQQTSHTALTTITYSSQHVAGFITCPSRLQYQQESFKT